MAIGNARYRRESTNPPHIMELKWRFTAREFSLFAGWFYHDLAQGNAWFGMPLAAGTGRVVTLNCHFVANYDWAGGAGGSYMVTAQVETRDWKTLTRADLDYLIAH